VIAKENKLLTTLFNSILISEQQTRNFDRKVYLASKYKIREDYPGLSTFFNNKHYAKRVGQKEVRLP